MKYDFTIPNFKRIINSDLVPANRSGLDIELGSTDICIKKPYIDDDGDEMGDSIFITKDDGLMIYMRIEAGFLLTFYREQDHENFKKLEAASPDYIRQFAWQIWTGTVDYLENAEQAGVFGEPRYLSFEQQFGMYSVPDVLKTLFEFESKYGAESYADGFYLTTINKTGLKTYSEEAHFLHSFIEFATATGAGSTYAIWVINEDLNKCPVVVFGDEGGVHPVAENIQDLIRLLTYDVEITVGWDDAYFYKGDFSEQGSEYRAEFAQWAKTTFDLDAVTTDEDADLLMQTASDRYADSLYDFLTKYGIDVDEGFDQVTAYRTFDAFENNFQGREIPHELLLLFDFQQEHSNYAQYFLLRGYDLSILNLWSEDAHFHQSIIPFARATSFGACYAFWDDGSGRKTDAMPVIVLDRENGINVVAENILQLLRLLTYDIEPVLSDEIFKLSNDKDSYAPSNNIAAYIKWLKNNFDVEPVADPFEEIIDPAQDKFSEAFENW